VDRFPPSPFGATVASVVLSSARQILIVASTGCFTTCGHYCRRWFPTSLWSKKFV